MGFFLLLYKNKKKIELIGKKQSFNPITVGVNTINKVEVSKTWH